MKKIIKAVLLFLTVFAACAGEFVPDDRYYEAVKNLEYDIVEKGLKRGIDINKEYNGEKRTVLLAGISCKDVKMLKLILKYRADYDVLFGDPENSFSNLTYAVTHIRHYDTIKTLLKDGADANGAKGETGLLPLIVAIINDDYHIAKLLIDYGADIHVKVKGFDCLDAIYYSKGTKNNATILKLLIKKKYKLVSFGSLIKKARSEGRTEVAEILQDEYDKIVKKSR